MLKCDYMQMFRQSRAVDLLCILVCGPSCVYIGRGLVVLKNSAFLDGNNYNEKFVVSSGIRTRIFGFLDRRSTN